MIDIGANLTHKTFSKNMPDILKNAHTANVRHIIITGTSVEASRSAIELCRRHNATNLDDKFPVLKCTVGIHPHDASRAMKNPKTNFEALEKLITENRDIVVAVGECGLDYDRQFSSHEDQVHVFTQQAMLARRLDMPLFLHERAAHDAFMQVVRDVNQTTGSGETVRKLRGVVHCFTGETVEVLNAYLEEGFYLGITGWVTDERPERGAGLARLVNKIPLDRLMVETDAPFLMPRNIKPSPKICEPALVGHVVKRLAELYNIDGSEVADCTTRNAVKLFSL
ncbi:metal-dependent hydrolase [Chytriomyces cf. hyalinus JEL632]|nr:metal-dependent hydrolase [Chytriomyces cf. hyalinus JEL632]